MRRVRMPARFEHVQERDQIGLRVGVRMGDRVAHARLRGEMNDAIESRVPEHGTERGRIGEIEFERGEPGMPPQAFEPGALEADIVVGVKIVDTGDVMPGGQQTFGGVHADEAGGAGDQHLHAPGALCAGSRRCSSSSLAFFMKVFQQPMRM